MSEKSCTFASQNAKRKEIIMQKENFQYYLDNQESLVRQYKGKFLVIVNKQVEGAYRTMREAAIKAAKRFALGTFLIQECTEGEEAYTQQFFNSNVLFV